MAQKCGGQGASLSMKRSLVQLWQRPRIRYSHMRLLPSSIIWYWTHSGDVVRPGM